MNEVDRKWIDNASYEELLRRWRFSKIGDPFFQGDTYDYYVARMTELRSRPGGQEEHVRASKAIGWEKYPKRDCY